MAWRASIGRHVQSVKVMACPHSQSSAAARFVGLLCTSITVGAYVSLCRKFWDKNYHIVKHLNPTFPFMIRPAPQLEPYLIVEYDFNRKAKVPVSGLDEQGLEKKFAEIVEVGMQMPKAEEVRISELPTMVE